MGMFCLPSGQKSGELVDCAMGNLQIFLESWKHDNGAIHCSNNYPNDYLLSMAISLLKQASDAYKKECEENPNINPPQPPDPLVDIELALEHAKGDKVSDCSMILFFLSQHHDQTNEFLGRLDPAVHSPLGVTAGLRYTWQRAGELTNWVPLRDRALLLYKSRDLFLGLLHIR